MTTILHVLDHSASLFTGYSSRSRSIVRFQQARGLRPIVVTSPKHGSETAGVEVIEGLSYHRTARTITRIPLVCELQQVARLHARITQVARAPRSGRRQPPPPSGCRRAHVRGTRAILETHRVALSGHLPRAGSRRALARYTPMISRVGARSS